MINKLYLITERWVFFFCYLQKWNCYKKIIAFHCQKNVKNDDPILQKQSQKAKSHKVQCFLKSATLTKIIKKECDTLVLHQQKNGVKINTAYINRLK